MAIAIHSCISNHFFFVTLSHSHFHGSTPKRIGPKTQNHWLFLFYGKKTWKKHTFPLWGSPTYPVLSGVWNFGRLSFPLRYPPVKCWTSWFTKKNMFSLGFYGVFFLKPWCSCKKLTTHVFVTRDCRVLSLHVHVVWTFMMLWSTSRGSWHHSEATRYCRVFRLVHVFEPTSATWTSIWSGSNRHWRVK